MDFKSTIKKLIGYKGSKLETYMYKRWRKKQDAKQAKLLKCIGNEVLDQLTTIADRYNVPIWVEYGTLLGAYREHGFIPHDFDIDMGMYAEDYTQSLEDELVRNGFEKIRLFKIINPNNGEQRVSEIAFVYKGLSIDLFMSFHHSETVRNTFVMYKSLGDGKYGVKEFYFPTSSPAKKAEINLKHYYSIGYEKEVLEICYGKNFMIPNAKWIAKKDNDNNRRFYDAEKELYGMMEGNWLLDVE